MKKKIPQQTKTASVPSGEDDFARIVSLIEQARQSAFQAINTHLVDLYWEVGEYISRKIEADGWGKGTVKELSVYIQKRQPGIRGFSPQNLWRMRQFYETYRGEPKLSMLLRELPWSANLHILTRAKRPEEREFYLRRASRDCEALGYTLAHA